MSHKLSRKTFIWIVAALLLLGFAVRAIALDGLPLYIDEASYAVRAHYAVDGHPFAGDNRKVLLYSILAIFNPTGAEGPWLDRYVVGLFGFITMASVISIARQLDSRRAGLLAGTIYALLPFATFHERNILADPVSATFITVGMALSLFMLKRQKVWLSLIIGVCLAAAYLTKNTALFYLSIAGVAAFFLKVPSGRKVRALLLGALSMIVALAIIWVVYDYIALATGKDATGLSLLTKGPRGAASGFKDSMTVASLLAEFEAYWEVSRTYLGWGVSLLVALSVVWVALNRKRREMLFLLVPAIVFALPVVIVPKSETGVLVPRLLVAPISSLAVLAALSLNQLWIFFQDRLRDRSVYASGLALILVVGPFIPFNFLLLTRPFDTPLYITDRVNWQHGFLSGAGQAEMNHVMAQAYRDGDGTPLGVMMPDIQPIRWVRAYLGPRTAEVENSGFNNEPDKQLLAEWLAEGRTVFLVHYADLRERDPYGAQLELIGKYDPASYDYPLYLFRVVGAEGELASAIYGQDESVYDADYLDTEYESVSALFLPGLPDPVYVFPETAAEGFAVGNTRTIRPVPLTRWPYEEADARQAVAAIAATHQSQFVETVFVSEYASEPSLLTGLAFVERFYTVLTQQNGPVKYRRMLVGPESPQELSHDAVFNQTVMLTGSGVLDQVVSAGGFVRVTLTWETLQPITDRWWMFAHVFRRDEEEFVAQYDSEPGAGLKPTSFWEPSVPVTDRFAVSLPPDLPPGNYEIRVGLYHPETFARMSITAGTDVGVDYAVIGVFTIEP